MALTRLDNLYSSKTGRYLYVSPDDFNATDELDNRGNSPLRPFKTIQRAFIEVARYSYLPGKNNDRFDQFSIMLMPGNHYIDNRPGLVGLGAAVAEDRGRFFDAANLILENKNLIAYEAVYRLLANPTLGTASGFSVPGGNQNCIDDIISVIEEVAYNLKFGGNDRVWDAANLYVTGSYVAGEEAQSIYAFQQARDMAIQAMRNELITIQGNHGYTQYVDNSITLDTEQPLCANVAQAISSLFGIVITAIDDDSLTNITKSSPTNTEELPLFNFNQALQEWNDNSILDLSNPDNVLYKFNATTGGAIVPRGCSLVGYDLRRTIIRPLYVPDPVDSAQERTSIFNLTGGCYLWQFTIKDGDLSSNSPLYDSTAGVGKVYFRKNDTENLAIPEYSHHKICIMTYADNAELDLYYQKVAKSFSKFQPTIDDGDLEALVQENRIVGPLSDTRTIESIKPINATSKLIIQVTTKIDHGYFEGQYVAILNSGLADDINGTFKITKIDQNNPRIFEYEIPEKVAAAFNLTDGQLYTIANGLDNSAVSQAEIDSVESASPYVFNCSIRSTWGLCGMWADGSKATGFKSMVVAQYTGVSLQKDDRAFIRYDRFTNTWNQASLKDAFATIPYHAKGDAYWKDDWRNFHIRASDDAFIQCVSVFAVGFFDHFLMESGGDMSITNSNSNFGNTSLHAVGFKGFAFNQDKGGYITDIIPPKAITGGYSDDPTKDSFNSKKISYYPFDVRASNDASNHTKLYISSDTASNPNDRPAATLQGYRLGARSGERVFVDLEPINAGGPSKFYSTLTPTGFRRFTASLETLNPSGVQINNKAQDAANIIEANRSFIQDEAYTYITEKYPTLLQKVDIDITKCRRDVGYFVDAVVSDLRLGGNVNTIQAAEAYYVGGQLQYIVGEKTETIETIDYIKNLCIIAMRNFDVLIQNCKTVANSAIVDVGSTVGLVVGMEVKEYDPTDFEDGKVIDGSAPITSNIRTNSYIKRIVDGQKIELGNTGSYLDKGLTRPAQSTSNSAYLYFTLDSSVLVGNNTIKFENVTQDTEYPECNSIASTIVGYFDNVKTILNVGIENNGVIKQEPTLESAKLASRATLFTINGSNPHDLETGTPVRLVPKARQGTNPDKRVIRLPKEFSTNTKYYIIAPGRATYPENYADTLKFGGVFDGSDQTKFMLARSKENACAGIYIYSPETDSIDPDVEIEIQQYLLDEKYDLHRYKCNLLNTTVIETDVAHVFDLPANGITPQKVFFRVADDIIGSELPQISGQGTIDTQTYFYPRYNSAKTFTIHRSLADAISGINAVTFSPSEGKNFYVFADKRVSPLRFDATFKNEDENNTSGLWYLNVLDESSTNNLRTDSILYRLQQADYNDDSGKIRTNDTWYERVNDDRTKEDRIYRLRYVIPNYLETVRDPLNGFVLKVRTDDKRRLKPQRILLKPVGDAISVASFYNPANVEEKLGLRIDEYETPPTYDPYSPNGVKIVSSEKTNSKISFSIQSARKVEISDVEYLEIVAFDHTITNTALKNEIFTVLRVTAPQGGTFTPNNQITWTGNSSGIGTLHGYYTVGNLHHIIIRNITSGSIEYNSLVNTRFTQGSTFVDLLAKPDSTGDSQGRSKSDRKDYLYRVDGANVYTLVPGDVITDDTNAQYVIDSVQDVGDLEDTFYIFDIDEIQERIPNQQDGIYYLTCIKGNISPYPTGAGVGDNFKNFKFSQPISQLYPQNYKNDPFWFKQIDPTFNDAPETISAADNYIHGLVTVNDSKFNETKELVLDLIESPVLNSYDYDNQTTLFNEVVDNRIRAQEGNATSGSEDRKIPIAGNSKYVTEQKLFVELRRPSIARSGNHTFEYLGFGPGNYSTGFPLRQEVVLEDSQNQYAQSKREDGGVVFYTGLNSNGDLYIGNRKINAITGEETYLEKAELIDAGGDDDEENTGSLVTTFDVPVTFNERITVNGPATFTDPVQINVEANEGLPLRVYSKVTSSQDTTLNRGSYSPPEKGDITIGNNRVQSAIFGLTGRSSPGLIGQSYSIRTHYLNGIPSNVTPNNSQKLFTEDSSSNKLATGQTVSFVDVGAKPGDIILKGANIGNSGSVGWIFANSYTDISSNIDQVIFDGTSNVKVVLKSTVTNAQVGLSSDAQIRVSNFTGASVFNGIWDVKSSGFDATDNEFVVIVAGNSTVRTVNWSDEPASAKLEVSNSNWKEVGVIGAEALRTQTSTLGDYRLGINTVARTAHSALETAFVSSESNPRANLDVVGTAFISGKTVPSYRSESSTTKTQLGQQNAFLVGGDSGTPDSVSILRVDTLNNRVGINTTVNNNGDPSKNLDRSFVVIGNGRITSDFEVNGDLKVNGGDITSSSTSFNLFNNTVELFNIFGSAQSINLANNTTTNQNINIGNAANSQYLRIGNAAKETVLRIHSDSTNASVDIASVADSSQNICNITLGGAFSNTDSKTNIETRQTRLAGELEIGTKYAPGTSQARIFTQARIANVFDGDQTNTVNLGLNATSLTLGSLGGTTTVRNALSVFASATVDGNINLDGGLNAGIVTIERGRFSTTISSHNVGSLANSNIDFYQYASTGRKIDTKGNAFWGGNSDLVGGGQIAGIDEITNNGGSNRPAGTYSFIEPEGGTGAGALFTVVVNADKTININQDSPGSGYTDNDLLTIQNSSLGNGTGGGTLTFRVNGTNSAGSTYFLPITTPSVFDFKIGDLILIDRGNSGSPNVAGEAPNQVSNLRNQAFSEIVRVVGLANLNNPNDPNGYRVEVTRGQEGTTVRTDHPDGCVIAKLNKQANASFITGADLNNDGVLDDPVVGIGNGSANVNIGISEFGGVLTTDDYLRLSGTEFVKVAATVSTNVKSLVVNDGGIPKATVFEVQSTTGNTKIFGNLSVGSGFNKFTVNSNNGNTAIAGTLTTENTLTINGSTLANTEFFKITNGGADGTPLRTTFQIDTSNGNVVMNGGNLNIYGTDGTTPRLTFVNSSGDFTTYGSFSALGTGTSTFGGSIEAAGDLLVKGGDLTVQSNGSTKFAVANDGAVTVAGIPNYFTRTGGGKWVYTSDTVITGVSNYNYFINATGNTLFKLPANPLIGDMIRIIDISGSLTYNLSLVVRAFDNIKVQGSSSNTGTAMLTGVPASNLASYNGGELIVQTPYAAFALVYAGATTPDGNPGVPSSLVGWYLIEV